MLFGRKRRAELLQQLAYAQNARSELYALAYSEALEARREGRPFPVSQLYILHIPSYFRKIYIFPPSAYFWLNLHFFFPPILTMVHLRIVLYPYWTPLLCPRSAQPLKCGQTFNS